MQPIRWVLAESSLVAIKVEAWTGNGLYDGSVTISSCRLTKTIIIGIYATSSANGTLAITWCCWIWWGGRRFSRGGWDRGRRPSGARWWLWWTAALRDLKGEVKESRRRAYRRWIWHRRGAGRSISDGTKHERLGRFRYWGGYRWCHRTCSIYRRTSLEEVATSSSIAT